MRALNRTGRTAFDKSSGSPIWRLAAFIGDGAPRAVKDAHPVVLFLSSS